MADYSYHDATIPFIEAIVGPERICRAPFNDEAERRNPD